MHEFILFVFLDFWPTLYIFTFDIVILQSWLVCKCHKITRIHYFLYQPLNSSSYETKMNRPFSSINTNLLNEQTFNSTPTNLYGQNVLVSQDQNRRIYDTVTTSINGIPSCHNPCAFSMPPCQQFQTNYPNPCSNSMIFTFQPQPAPCCAPCYSPCIQPPPPWRCSSLPYQNEALALNCQQMRLNELNNRVAMDLANLQRGFQPNAPPFQLKFHLDHETSTFDLPAHSAPDVNTTSVVEDLRKDEVTSKNCCGKEGGSGKNVTFDGDVVTQKEAGSQAHICCNCCKHDETEKVDSSTETDESDQSSVRPTKQSSPKRKKKKSASSKRRTTSSDSDSEE